MSKDVTTWYVVADGGKARILTLEGGAMRTLQHFDNSGHGDTDIDPSAGTSQLKAPKADPHDQAKQHFAKQVAARLNEAVRTGQVDELVLAASAHVLHDIREELNKAATAALKTSLSKDLTNISDHDLASHFA
ncbi:host attachment protein [Lichenicola sp.]|uniref:baeRF12 domain-containing protein n=1 Tax=Lichenicola sp. TaxID=2804529 RepID=UPI003B001538